MKSNFAIFKKGDLYSGNAILEICGQPYRLHPNDPFIFHAIELANEWSPHQVTFERIAHLRNWLRENYQHDHNIPFLHIQDMPGCKYLIDSIIQAEYANIGEHYKEAFLAALRENEKLFSD